MSSSYTQQKRKSEETSSYLTIQQRFCGQVIAFATEILKLILSFRTTSRIDRFNLSRKSDIAVSETENTH